MSIRPVRAAAVNAARDATHSRRQPSQQYTAPVKRSISTFRASHDPSVIVPAKLTKALEAMAKEGDEVYAYEAQDSEGAPTIQSRSGLSAAQIAMHRKVFAAHIVRVDAAGSRRGKFVWFATRKAATAARGGPVNPADFE